MILKIAIISWVFVKLGEPGEVFDWYQRLIWRLPDKLWKPLGGCSKCLAGQVMFWHFIFTNEYHFVTHALHVSLTILLVVIFDWINEKLELWN